MSLRHIALTTVVMAIVSLQFASHVPAQDAATDPTDINQLFVVPQGNDVAKLARFLQRLTEFRPSSQDDIRIYERKAPLAMRKAAEKIVALEKDTKSAAYRTARRHLLREQASQVSENEGASDADRKKVLDELVKFIASGEPTSADAQLAVGYAVNLEYAPARELAAEAYSKLGQIFAESKDADLASRGKMLLGAAKRLNLVGQPFELKGTTIDGKPFDLASLKGKVVLVDFWATWCGPCRREMPHVKELYEKHGGKGFDVVGISLDEDQEALAAYLEENAIRWETLAGDGTQDLAEKYGVRGIPTMMLVDKEGQIAGVAHNVAALAPLVEKLLK